MSFMASHMVDDVADFIQIQSRIEPLELSVIGNRALLTDGNHRIVTAKRLGYTTVPVTIIVFFGEGKDTFMIRL